MILNDRKNSMNLVSSRLLEYFCKKMLKRQEYYEEEEMDDEAGRRQCGK